VLIGYGVAIGEGGLTVAGRLCQGVWLVSVGLAG